MVPILISLSLGYEGGVTGLTCGGDSGGPLVIFDSHKEQHIQVGVVSGGRCQSYNDPSIFARIEDHEILEFIMKQTWDNIPPTGRKAIEKLIADNNYLKSQIQKVEDKNIELENIIKQNGIDLVDVKSMLEKGLKKVNDDCNSKAIETGNIISALSETSKVHMMFLSKMFLLLKKIIFLSVHVQCI